MTNSHQVTLTFVVAAAALVALCAAHIQLAPSNLKSQQQQQQSKQQFLQPREVLQGHQQQFHSAVSPAHRAESPLTFGSRQQRAANLELSADQSAANHPTSGAPLPLNAAGQPTSSKSNHRLVNKIKDARHRRRHRHHRHRHHLVGGNGAERHNRQQQLAAFAAMTAANAIEPAAQAASTTALTALESIVEEVARAQLPQQQQQQAQNAPPAPTHQPPASQLAQANGSSSHVSPVGILLDGSTAQVSSVQQASESTSSNFKQLTVPSASASSATLSTPAAQMTTAGANVPTIAATPIVSLAPSRGPLHSTRSFLLTSTLSKIYNLLNVTEFALEMRDGISSRASCVACNAVVGLFLSPLYSKEVFSAAIRTVCTSFKIQTPRVCAGFADTFQDDFEYIRHNTKLTRDEICGVIFGVDCARRQTYNLFWTIPIPDLPNRAYQQPNKSNQYQELTANKQHPNAAGVTIPIKDQPYTNLDDAPDLFEYRKSSPTALASSASTLMSQSSASQSDHISNSNNNNNNHTGTNASVQKTPKALASSNRPQYIFDDEFTDSNISNEGIKFKDHSKNQRDEISTFVQITDIHVDPYYEPGSLNECNEPLCCRATSGPAPSDKRRQAGRWGDYGNCDVPVRTVHNALNRIREQHSDAEYWIWTGDISPHDVWNITKHETSNHVRLLTKLVRDYSGGRPVFPVIGNHEGHPVNSFAPPEITSKHFSSSWLYNLLADQWSDWLPSEALATFRFGGFYKLQVRKGFRIIALNTNYCARLNPWSFYDPVDPANQLKWLTDELLEAEMNQDKVHIIGHVPPDHRECTQAWLFNFINIVDRFKRTILAQFYGHTHRDEFRVIYSMSKTEEPIGIQYIGPSITPFTENNPAYRVYRQDKQGHLLDSETYFFNLTEANQTPTSEPNWQFSYSTRSHLNFTQGLDPDQWNLYMRKMSEEDLIFDDFYKNFYRSSDVKYNQTCRNKCKYQLLSDMRLLHPYKIKPKPFLANRKTNNHHREHHHHKRLRHSE